MTFDRQGFRVLLCSALCVCAVACQPHTSEKHGFEFHSSQQSAEIQQLLSRVETYYAAEAGRNWSAAYELRTANFRKLVPKATYILQMAESAKGWQVLRVEVLQVAVRGSEASLRLRFAETFDHAVASREFASSIAAGENIVEGDGLWEYDGANWYCTDAVTRNHLPLNSQMTY